MSPRLLWRGEVPYIGLLGAREVLKRTLAARWHPGPTHCIFIPNFSPPVRPNDVFVTVDHAAIPANKGSGLRSAK